MVGKAKRPTAAEKRRLETLKEHIPCVPCLTLIPAQTRLPTIQHVVTGMKREGHQKTYSSCEWHHLGIKPEGMPTQQILGMLGPSLAHGKRTFQEHFGPEQLFVRLADFLIEEYEKRPWLDYSVPYDCKRRILLYWQDKTVELRRTF